MDHELETHLVRYGGWEMLKLYTLALADSEFCGVVRAKRRDGGGGLGGGEVVGTVVLCRGGTALDRWIPGLVAGGEGRSGGEGVRGNYRGVAGVLGPVVREGEDEGVLVGLLLLGVRQGKANKGGSVFLDLVSRVCSLLWCCRRRRVCG